MERLVESILLVTSCCTISFVWFWYNEEFTLCACVRLRVYLCSPFPCGKNSIFFCLCFVELYFLLLLLFHPCVIIVASRGVVCFVICRTGLFFPLIYSLGGFYRRVFAAASFLLPFISWNTKSLQLLKISRPTPEQILLDFFKPQWFGENLLGQIVTNLPLLLKIKI